MSVMGFQNKKFGWGWVGGVSSIQVFFWIFWNLFNFAKPLSSIIVRFVIYLEYTIIISDPG